MPVGLPACGTVSCKHGVSHDWGCMLRGMIPLNDCAAPCDQICLEYSVKTLFRVLSSRHCVLSWPISCSQNSAQSLLSCLLKYVISSVCTLHGYWLHIAGSWALTDSSCLEHQIACMMYSAKPSLGADALNAAIGRLGVLEFTSNEYHVSSCLLGLIGLPLLCDSSAIWADEAYRKYFHKLVNGYILALIVNIIKQYIWDPSRDSDPVISHCLVSEILDVCLLATHASATSLFDLKLCSLIICIGVTRSTTLRMYWTADVDSIEDREYLGTRQIHLTRV